MQLVVSHTSFSLFSIRVATAMTYDFSFTILYNLGILDKLFCLASLKSNFNRSFLDNRGTAHDFCYLLNFYASGT